MTLTLIISCVADFALVMNADEFRNIFFSGIPVQNFDNYRLTNQQIENVIKQKQTQTESFLDLKISPMILTEECYYEDGQFKEWGYMRTNYELRDIISLKGVFGSQEIVTIPDEILFVQSQLDLNNHFNIMPYRYYFIIYQSGFYFLMGYKYIPNFWHVKYMTGFKQIPADIFDYVGKRALNDIYNLMGNILLPIGITSSSKSIDSVSQSTSTTRSGTTNLFTASQNWLKEEMKIMEDTLKSKYKRIQFFRV